VSVEPEAKSLPELKAVPVIAGCRPENVADSVAGATAPLVLKSLVADWPMVKASLQSPEAAMDYISQFYNGKPLTVSTGSPAIKGRVAYNEALTGFNFSRANVTLDQFAEQLFKYKESAEPPAYYIGSTMVDNWFPGFRANNDLLLADIEPMVSLWIGNQIRVSAHFDVPDNIACCVAGRRKFTLFPPEQLENLYIGPWDVTPAGQPISLVDFNNPDFDQFPKFRRALDAAYEVILEPGDALFLPSMWWHHVEGLDRLNMLVNYWWRSTPRFMGAPLSVFKHALLSLRDLPPEQRRAWKHIFETYIFDPKDSSVEHIPENSRGILSPMTDSTARQLRAELLNLLNR